MAGPDVVGRDVKDVEQPDAEALKPTVVGPDSETVEKVVGPASVELPDPHRPRPVRAGATSPDDVWYLDVVAVGTARGYSCSGVVIAPRLVLTARHCGAVKQIALGSRLAGRPLAVHEVQRIVVHPDPAVDAVLLHLAAAVPVPPRPRRGARDGAPPSGTVRLIGFGLSDFRTRTGFGTKRRVDVLVHGWGCDGRRSARTGCRPDVEMLVASDRGNDTCDGDSGGAVLELVDGRWRLIAITSRAVAPASRACGEGGIYVRADYLDRWIEQTMKELP